MASSGNFCTLNPLTQPNAGTFSEGNLLFTHTASAWRSTLGTLGMTSGKWYWEAYQKQYISTGNGWPVGIYDMDSGKFAKNLAGNYPGQSTSTYGASYAASSSSHGEKHHNGSSSSLGFSSSSSGDTWQCAFDADAGKIWFGKNNTWANSGNPSGGSNEAYASIPSSTWSPLTCSYNSSNSENYPYNFGQDDTFSGRVTAQGNTDDNGHGVFKYAPPTGFLALCSANLPISDDIDPAQTDDDIPTKQFGIGLYTGQSGGGNSVVCGFQPDLIWGKLRSGSQTGILIDSSRGQGLLFSATTDDEQTSNGPFISSYNSDGFTFASSGSNPNDNGGSYVAWCWRANGGTTASNSEGDITSTVQANTKAGFSIVTYTGNRTSSGVSTVGHGLSSAPDMVITKSRSNSGNWWVQHIGTSTASKMLNLQATSAETDKSGNGTLSRPTATVFGTNHTDGLGTNGETHIAYCWHSVEGYSKFGFFEGNNDDDGAFIYTGFRPRLVFIKNIDATNRWIVHDSARRTFNPMNLPLDWDESYGEYTSASRQIDFLSNGFKCRTSDASINGSNTYVYGAWGDVPFKYNNTF